MITLLIAIASLVAIVAFAFDKFVTAFIREFENPNSRDFY